MEETIYYGPKGQNSDENEFIAKHSIFEKGEAFWAWHWKGSLYDVYNDRGFLRRSPMAKLVRLDKEKFSYYIKYLKTRNRAFYTQASRT